MKFMDVGIDIAYYTWLQLCYACTLSWFLKFLRNSKLFLLKATMIKPLWMVSDRVLQQLRWPASKITSWSSRKCLLLTKNYLMDTVSCNSIISFGKTQVPTCLNFHTDDQTLKISHHFILFQDLSLVTQNVLKISRFQCLTIILKAKAPRLTLDISLGGEVWPSPSYPGPV